MCASAGTRCARVLLQGLDQILRQRALRHPLLVLVLRFDIEKVHLTRCHSSWLLMSPTSDCHTFLQLQEQLGRVDSRMLLLSILTHRVFSALLNGQNASVLLLRDHSVTFEH